MGRAGPSAGMAEGQRRVVVGPERPDVGELTVGICGKERKNKFMHFEK